MGSAVFLDYNVPVTTCCNAFSSLATNLVKGDTKGSSDAFLTELTQTFTLPFITFGNDLLCGKNRGKVTEG